MTVVFDNNGYKIQTFVIARANVGGTTTRIVDLTVDPIFFRSAQVTFDSIDLAGAGNATANISNTDNSEIADGQFMTALRVRLRNDTAGILNLGAKVVVHGGER